MRSGRREACLGVWTPKKRGRAETQPDHSHHTVIMLILLAGIFGVHIIGIILLLVATIDNAWWMTDTMATDVWGRWLLQNGKWNFTDLP
ncbi:unnamed protein product [Pleuronectes platessa]|uniref:Uncharacterized protein n=1 Tax=Pleuronectes platessa TaxID=8262 RepID=A0A9N7YHY0_PLEPL|nr:unnamed protein product [Pleuronectes platessa]